MLEIVICEDNEKVLQSFTTMLEKSIRDHSLNGRIVFKTGDPHVVEEFIRHKSANVFFLDIDLKCDEDGYALAKKIREANRKAYIVFTTGHLEYVFQAFKVRPFDFLPKPISREILETCLLNIYNDYTSAAEDETEAGVQYIEVKSGTSIYRIKTKDIIYIEKLNCKTIIHLANSMISCYETLETLERSLDGEHFIRCHKSFIANRAYVSEIRLNSNEIIFETGQACFIGRKYKKGLIFDAQIDFDNQYCS